MAGAGGCATRKEERWWQNDLLLSDFRAGGGLPWLEDAVCVLSPSTALADAAATFIGNTVRQKNDLQDAARQAKDLEGILGGVVILNDHLATWGEVELAEV